MIAYHLRQSFAPGEITPEEANRLGCELVRRFTKENHAYIVCTHTDKHHIHNHIIFNSTSISYDRKFRDFKRSGMALRQLSDTICIENGYSVIDNPKRHGKSYNKWRDEKEHVSNAGGLLIDIQTKLREGKGVGYERWAKSFNLKQMAQTVAFLQEHSLMDYVVLAEKTDAASARFHDLKEKIKKAETRMEEISAMRTQIINYAKTRETYASYRKAGYSKKFIAEHESEITIHKAAKRFFDEQHLTKLPTVKSLQEEYAALLTEKKAAYGEYRKVREEMIELLTAKANIDRILENTPDTPSHENNEKAIL